MAEPRLRGCRILVTEDEFLLADDLETELAEAGAVVVGPASHVAAAQALLAAERFDAAILDINLRGEMVYELADWLAARQVPFLFATGYDASVIPHRFDHVIRCDKPIQYGKVTEALARC